MGRLAAELLLGRISDDTREYRIAYLPSDLILRESTGASIE
jgi:DNA-binding LacI/PurR family transcriptional regulator